LAHRETGDGFDSALSADDRVSRDGYSAARRSTPRAVLSVGALGSLASRAGGRAPLLERAAGRLMTAAGQFARRPQRRDAAQRRLHLFTHHKFASTWLIRYAEAYCRINRSTFFTSHNSLCLPLADLSVLTNASYNIVRSRIHGGLHVIRNPLDVVVSAYYSHRQTHSLEGWPELSIQRQLLQSLDEASGMMATIAFLERVDFHRDAAGPLHALRDWDFDDLRFRTLRMEDVVCDPDRIGRAIQSKLGGVLPPAADFSFRKLSGRDPGEIDNWSHYRTGQPDRWRQELPRAAIEYLRVHFRGVLERFYLESLSD
jgi:hypothetical protein